RLDWLRISSVPGYRRGTGLGSSVWPRTHYGCSLKTQETKSCVLGSWKSSVVCAVAVRGGRAGAMCWPSDAVCTLDQCQGLCYYIYIAQGIVNRVGQSLQRASRRLIAPQSLPRCDNV